jgi:outer membrane receptor protein involved in Fe transport
MGGEVTSDGEIPRTTVAPASRRGVAAAATGRIETPVARIEAGARFDRLHAQAEAVIDTLGDDASPAIDALDEEWSGELGLVRRAGAFEPYGRVATGFRAPNLDERFHDGIVHGGLRIFGNPELSAETSITYELGLRYERPDVGRARVSVYRSDFEDFIEMAYLGQLYLIPRFQYVNVAEARVEGVELQMETRRGRFDLGITAAAPHGIDLETGARLPSAGTRRTTFDVQAHLPAPSPRVDDWRAAVRARWSDAVPAEAALAGDSESSSTTSFARSASWAVDVETRARLGTTELALSIRNLFDHAYREPLSYIEEPGRTFGISVRHDFALLSP